MIKRLIPKTSYERESFIKAFLLFFISINLLLGVIFFLVYEREVNSLKSLLFLKMKNFSYTFEGEDFSIDIVPNRGQPTFELLEDEKGLYILVPVPGVKEDLLRINYPAERFKEDLFQIRLRTFTLFGISSVVSLLISVAFSLYSINPLREALRIIEEVMKDIIHDINTPLMTLMVNLKLLKKRYQDEEIERAILAVKQLENLKDNLRPMVAKTALNIEEVDVKSILEEELSLISKLYPEVDVDLFAEKVKVKADKNALRRILSNILDNAFKHSFPKSWVRIRLLKGRLIVENPAKEIKNPSKLFERYYRESQRGIGLGLSIVKKLCGEMGWEVKAYYKEGIFRIEIHFS